MGRAEEAPVHVGALHAELRCRLAAHVARPRRCLVAGNDSNPFHLGRLDDASVTDDQFGAGTEIVHVAHVSSRRTEYLVDPPAHADSVTWATVELAQVSATLEPDASHETVERLQLRVRPGRDVQPDHRRARRLSAQDQHLRRERGARLLEAPPDVRPHRDFAHARSAQLTDAERTSFRHADPFSAQAVDTRAFARRFRLTRFLHMRGVALHTAPGMGADGAPVARVAWAAVSTAATPPRTRFASYPPSPAARYLHVI